MPPFKISTVSYTEIKLTFINRPPDGVFTLTCFTMELEKHALTYSFCEKQVPPRLLLIFLSNCSLTQSAV